MLNLLVQQFCGRLNVVIAVDGGVDDIDDDIDDDYDASHTAVWRGHFSSPLDIGHFYVARDKVSGRNVLCLPIKPLLGAFF